MKRVDLGINWRGMAMDAIRRPKDLNGPVWSIESLEQSPYYISAYVCPVCDEDGYRLYKLKLQEEIRTTAPEVFDNKEIGLWNIFTCPHCETWFASLNYLEDVFDLPNDFPGYQTRATDFTLAHYCLYSAPTRSHKDWFESFKKTLKIAADNQFNY